MGRILKQSKRFVLGICNCGCKQSIPIRNRRKELARYMKSHNVVEFVKHGSEHPSWKHGRPYNKNGYRLVWKPEHPKASRNYVYEHILVFEEYYNCCILPWIIIHHKNEVKDDNRIENLQPLTDSEHKRYHVLLLWKQGKYSRQLPESRSEVDKAMQGIGYSQVSIAYWKRRWNWLYYGTNVGINQFTKII